MKMCENLSSLKLAAFSLDIKNINFRVENEKFRELKAKVKFVSKTEA